MNHLCHSQTIYSARFTYRVLVRQVRTCAARGFGRVGSWKTGGVWYGGGASYGAVKHVQIKSLQHLIRKQVYVCNTAKEQERKRLLINLENLLIHGNPVYRCLWQQSQGIWWHNSGKANRMVIISSLQCQWEKHRPFIILWFVSKKLSP